MSADSAVIIQDPVDPHAVCLGPGLPASDRAWHLTNLDGIHHMLQRPGPARVSVHFPAAGGLYKENNKEDETWPAGYVLVSFTTGSGEPDADRRRHLQLMRALGAQLTGCQLRWSWRYEDEPWRSGDLLPADRASQ